MKTKKTIKVTALLSVIIFTLFVLCSCGAPKYTFSLCDLGGEVSFHTDLQRQYLENDDYNSITTYAKAVEELSRPNAVRLSWTANPNSKKAPEIVKYTIQLSTTLNFSDSLVFETAETYIDVYNLYVGTDYFWKVTAEFENGKAETSNVQIFITDSKAPRNLYVDGVTNVRDLGGWETFSGKKVKQGMIYRTGRLNISANHGIDISDVVIEITEAGISTMRDTLGIKSEIDLREVSNNEVGFITESPLGKDINYYSVPMSYNGNILTNNKERIKEFFELLADESNYPIIYHCNIGTDRTGLYAFLINGLLGVPEEDLYRDYLFSNFGLINSARTVSGIQSTYIKTIKTYQGSALSEKIKNCLLDIGVKQEHIDKVLEIMYEE